MLVQFLHSGDPPVAFPDADLADWESLIIPRRHPDLPAKGLDRYPSDVATHLFILEHDVGNRVAVAIICPRLGSLKSVQVAVS